MTLPQPQYLAMEDKAAEHGELALQHARSSGLYVVKGVDDDGQIVYRFGKKEDCVLSRVRHHGGARKSFDNISGDLMPYQPLAVWLLPHWPAYRVHMAEQVMFGALQAQSTPKYFSQTRRKTDKSNYAVGDGFDWNSFRNRVDVELNALAQFGA